MGFVGLLFVITAGVLFRRAAFQPRFRTQLCWLLGGVAAGFVGVTLAGGLSILQIAFLGIVAFLWHAFLREPEPDRYYWESLYYSGFGYLIVLNLLYAGGGWTGSLLASVFYAAGYLTVKYLVRDYERT